MNFEFPHPRGVTGIQSRASFLHRRWPIWHCDSAESGAAAAAKPQRFVRGPSSASADPGFTELWHLVCTSGRESKSDAAVCLTFISEKIIYSVFIDLVSKRTGLKQLSGCYFEKL